MSGAASDDERGADAPASRADAGWLIPLATIVLAVWMCAVAAAERNGISSGPLVAGYAANTFSAFSGVVAAVLLHALAKAALRGDRRPAASLLGAAQLLLRSPWALAARLAPLVLFPFLLGAFGTLKVLLPEYAPFAHDALLIRVDRLLFATDPWRLTHALLGGDAATVALDRVYTFWIYLLPASIAWFTLSARLGDRARFLLAMALVWSILGVAGAYAASSAGPIFLAQIGHPDAAAFDPLIRRLERLDGGLTGGLDAIRWRDVLWRAHDARDLSFGMGISAMPSLHNAVSTVYVFAAFRLGRPQGWAAAVFAVLIFVGSVHLGWHYAVDGLVSAIAAAIIWTAVDRYLRATGFDAAAAQPGGISGPAVRAAAAGAHSA